MTRLISTVTLTATVAAVFAPVLYAVGLVIMAVIRDHHNRRNRTQSEPDNIDLRIPREGPGVFQVPIPPELADMSAFDVEHAVLAFYDAAGTFLGRETIGIGTPNQVDWTTPDVVLAVAKHPTAATAIHAHNHPVIHPAMLSDNTLIASQADVNAVQGSQIDLWRARRLLHLQSHLWQMPRATPPIHLTDALVIGRQRAFSIRRFVEQNGGEWEIVLKHLEEIQ